MKPHRCGRGVLSEVNFGSDVLVQHRSKGAGEVEVPKSRCGCKLIHELKGDGEVRARMRSRLGKMRAKDSLLRDYRVMLSKRAVRDAVEKARRSFGKQMYTLPGSFSSMKNAAPLPVM